MCELLGTHLILSHDIRPIGNIGLVDQLNDQTDILLPALYLLDL